MAERSNSNQDINTPRGDAATERGDDFDRKRVKDVSAKEIANDVEFQAGHGPEQGTSD